MLLLLSGLAVIGAMPVFLLVAALTRCSASQAQRRTMTFLERWGGLAPENLKAWIKQAIGSSAGFVLLVALAAVFNWLGDGAMPAISRSFGHFGTAETAWSEEHRSDWVKFREGIRNQWGREHPDEDLTSDKQAWEQWKTNRGKDWVRVPRTLVFFSLLLVIAGIVDITARKFRQRGAVLAIVGMIAFVVFSFIWADRKAHYVREVMVANNALGLVKQPVPASWSGTR